ncbi:6221_t:CDS:1, partial [Rhizophagus irregularis]
KRDRKNTNQWICNCPLIFKHLVEMIDGGENVSDSNNDVKKIRVSNSKASTFYETS